MQIQRSGGRLVISFPTTHQDAILDFPTAVARFAAVDPRWRLFLELAAASLSDEAHDAFGASLGVLEPGLAPTLLPFEVDPDDEAHIRAEAQHMPTAHLTAIGVLVPARLGFGHHEIAVVQGLISAVHRLLRIAKARS